ncbi:hypothetical protein COLO4_15078 [Corchorus olitorius]|uniref:Uncharacterized protein n=1 Tax=Corchorus olitorius TaxID=93759 RepID=A0A1R3JQ25_9ROSI|nr:hypothetical protein COLO4_15078 [Corchorus olitorius]
MRGVDWSNLPLDIVERIIGHLGSLDRINMKAVCKAWSVSTPHIPTIDNFPWALSGDRLIYPPLQKQFRGEEFQKIREARAHASSHGWVLYEVVEHEAPDFASFFLYSPFTSEVIKLPESNFMGDDVVATFSLDATSPKCVIFGLSGRIRRRNTRIYICSPGDNAWKTYEISIRKNVEHAAYAGDGVFYCVFSEGELGAFNLRLKEWSMLTSEELEDFNFRKAKLIASDGDLRLTNSQYQILKFDFSEKRWVEDLNLNNRVLFIGGTCFSCPAVGETSQLANHVFLCDWQRVRCYGTKYSDSLQYQNWLWTALRSWIWIEFPSGVIWRANDLMTAP